MILFKLGIIIFIRMRTANKHQVYEVNMQSLFLLLSTFHKKNQNIWNHQPLILEEIQGQLQNPNEILRFLFSAFIFLSYAILCQ